MVQEGRESGRRLFNESTAYLSWYQWTACQHGYHCEWQVGEKSYLM
jgi:hypothetical protein